LYYILKVNSGNLDSFRHRVIRTTILPPKKLVDHAHISAP